MAIVIGVVQVGLWAHANSVAQAAADHGVEVAASFGSSDEAGQAAALEFLGQVGAIRNGEAIVAGNPAPDQVTMIVRASYPSVFGLLDVQASATTIRERTPVGPP